jgi:hypothetical protein
VLLYKLESSIYPNEEDSGEPCAEGSPYYIPMEKMSDLLRVALRLLMLSNLQKIKHKATRITNEIK